MLEIIRKIIDVQNDISVCELATSVLIQELWLELYKHADFSCANNTHTDALASSQARLQLMMQYIHQNYQCNLSLDNIADYAGLSKSTILNLFQKYLHTTPINYLINYRLNEAAILLSKTEKKIITISNETGFNLNYS